MNEYKRLKDVFTLDVQNPVPVWADWTNKGIFTRLKAIAPWANTVDEKQLNDLYALSRQEKILSTLGVGVFFDMQYTPGAKLSGASTYIANLAYTKFSEKWGRLWEARQMEYNPIENYNMIETGEDTNTKSGSVSRTDGGTVTDTHTGNDTIDHTGTDKYEKFGKEEHSRSGSETHTKNGSETHAFSGSEKTTNEVVNNDTSTNNGVYGFNSSVPVNSDVSTGTQEGVSTSELEFTDRENTDTYDDVKDVLEFDQRKDTDEFKNRYDLNTKTLQDKTTRNTTDTQTRNLTGGETYNNVKDKLDHSLTRSGNIGVTTTQQMLEQELNIWDVFDYFEIIFKDIDSIMLLDIY